MRDDLVHVKSFGRSGSNLIAALLAENFFQKIIAKDSKGCVVNKQNEYHTHDGRILNYNPYTAISRNTHGLAMPENGRAVYICRKDDRVHWKSLIAYDFAGIHVCGDKKKPLIRYHQFISLKQEKRRWFVDHGAYPVWFEDLCHQPIKILDELAERFELTRPGLWKVPSRRVGWRPAGTTALCGTA